MKRKPTRYLKQVPVKPRKKYAKRDGCHGLISALHKPVQPVRERMEERAKIEGWGASIEIYEVGDVVQTISDKGEKILFKAIEAQVGGA